MVWWGSKRYWFYDVNCFRISYRRMWIFWFASFFCLDVGRPFKNIFFFHLMGFLHLVKLTAEAVAFQVPHFNSLALTLRSALNLFEYSQEASFILLLTHPKRLFSLEYWSNFSEQSNAWTNYFSFMLSGIKSNLLQWLWHQLRMKKNVVCQRHAGASPALGVKYDGTFLELLESLHCYVLLCHQCWVWVHR